MDYLDIHTHQRRQQTEVKNVLNVRADEISALDSDGWISVGVHPWYFTAADCERQLQAVECHAGDAAVKLIGECGFDRLRGPELTVQRKAFVGQAALALQYNKPMIIHCVRAFDELLRQGRPYVSTVPMIVHGFNKSPQLGAQLGRHGFLLSFGHALGQPSSGAAATFRQIQPPFFLETDDSSLDISEIYAYAAFLRNIAIDELKALIFASWKKLQLI